MQEKTFANLNVTKNFISKINFDSDFIRFGTQVYCFNQLLILFCLLFTCFHLDYFAWHFSFINQINLAEKFPCLIKSEVFTAYRFKNICCSPVFGLWMNETDLRGWNFSIFLCLILTFSHSMIALEMFVPARCK